MREKLKTSFARIHAETDLKDGTREYLLRRMAKQPKRPAARRKLLAAMICLVLALAGIGGGSWVYFTPVSAVSIDINPSIEIIINRFDKALSVEGYNEDGKAFASELNVRHMNYMDAINMILEDRTITDCLARDDILTIMVVSADEARQREMLANVKNCAAGYRNVHCGMGHYEDVSAAHTHGLSFGKYQAYLELQSLDADIAPEEIQDWTMREIQDRIDDLCGEDHNAGQSEPGHYGHGHGHGHGHGYGWGNRE